MDATSTADLQHAFQAFVARLVPFLARRVTRELRAERTEGDADPWVDQVASPLGRRAHCRACREGRIEGARKVGKRWLVRRSALDAHVQAIGRAPHIEDGAPASGIPGHDSDEPTQAEIEAVLRAGGLCRTARGDSRTRGR